MKAKICFCPKSIAWIGRNLKHAALKKWKAMIFQGFIVKRKTKRRTAKQRAATRRLIAFNKRRRR